MRERERERERVRERERERERERARERENTGKGTDTGEIECRMKSRSKSSSGYLFRFCISESVKAYILLQGRGAPGTRLILQSKVLCGGRWVSIWAKNTSKKS